MLQPSEERQEPVQPPFELFYCYAHEDRLLRNELDKHLTSLYRSKLIISWYDGGIVPGAAWEQEIETHLNSAHILLLLISPDFISSEYCYSKEMRRAIERHYKHEARVIPILLRPVYWMDTPFSELQMLPTDARPVTRWEDKDAAFEDITKGIRLVITELSVQRVQKQEAAKSALEQQVVPPSAPPIVSKSDVSLNGTQNVVPATPYIEHARYNKKAPALQQPPALPKQSSETISQTLIAPPPQQNISLNNQPQTQQETRDQTTSASGNTAVTSPPRGVQEGAISTSVTTPSDVPIAPAVKRANPSIRQAPAALLKRAQKGKLKAPQPGRRGIILSVVAILLLLAGGMLSVIVPPLLSANVTIVPDSKEVQDSYVMQAVTTQANADQLQVSMRNLSVAPDAQSKTVAGTGGGTGGSRIAGVAARGKLTFINGGFAPFTVASGTVIRASNGVTVITEQPAVVPAAVPGGANGSTSVPAHAVVAGTGGNLDQGSINEVCCSAASNIVVRNDVAFTGGVDPKDYKYVRQEDVDAVATPLENTLSQEASTQFKEQLKPNEKLVGDPTCNSHIQVPSGTVGDQGHAIASTTITVTAKCTGVVYDGGAALTIAKDRLQKKANIDPGQDYSLVGNIAADVSVSKVNQDSISLLVNARGIWAYQFNDAQKLALVHSIAGKKVSEVLRYLDTQRGITSAKIDAKSNTLPTDLNRIDLAVQKVSGENASSDRGNTTSNGTPIPGTPTPVPGKG